MSRAGRTTFAALAILLLLPAAGASGRTPVDWPAFRGANRAGSIDASLPTSWDPATGENVIWRRPVPGYSHSSPVVAEDSVFVATAVSEDPAEDGRRTGARNNAIADLTPREWRLLALDRDSGEVLWERIAHRGEPRVRRHEKGSHANSTPATDGERVVAVFNSEGIYCWDTDGELLWSRDLGRLDPGYWGQPDNPWGHASSPVIFEDLVIVQSDDFQDSFLAAFRLEDGGEVWRVARQELATWTTPVLHRQGDRVELIAQGGNAIRAYDPRTGRELWSFADHAQVKVPSPLVHQGLLVLSGGAPAGRPMFGLDLSAAPTDGATHPPLRWEIPSGGPYTPTPLAVQDRLFVARDNGVFTVYSLEDGEMLHRRRLGAAFSASPVAAGGTVYLAGEDGQVYAVDSSGPEYELRGSTDMGEPIFATPALTADRMFVRTRGHLTAVGWR